MKLGEVIARVRGFYLFPHFLDVAGDIAEAFAYQLILRPEVAVERHFIGAGGFRDGVHTNSAESAFAE